MDALALLSRTEGIIPAIESAHAVAGGLRLAERLAAEKGPEATVLINLSGRGDKDMGTAIEWFGLGDPERDTAEPVGDPDTDPRSDEEAR
jgi:tryptophan synthase beta chain